MAKIASLLFLVSAALSSDVTTTLSTASLRSSSLTGTNPRTSGASSTGLLVGASATGIYTNETSGIATQSSGEDGPAVMASTDSTAVSATTTFSTSSGSLLSTGLTTSSQPSPESQSQASSVDSGSSSALSSSSSDTSSTITTTSLQGITPDTTMGSTAQNTGTANPASVQTTAVSASMQPTVSSSTNSEYLQSPFVVAGSITVPAQTAIESGVFSTITAKITGPPSSYTVTTTKGTDNKETILPVFFGSDGLGMIVFPKVLNGPPGIIPPPIGFPTIHIGPNGNPTVNNDNNNNNAPTDNGKPTSNPTDSHESDASKVSETKSRSSETSSTTSCTQSAVTHEVINCLTVVGDKSTATVSCATVTSTASGCGVTGLVSTIVSTSTTSSSPTPYIIIPQDPASSNDRSSFQSNLEGQIGKNNVKSATDNNGMPVFWVAPLNPNQVKDITSSSAVISAVIPDGTFVVEDIDGSDADPQDSQTAPPNAAAATPAPTGASKREAKSAAILPRGALVKQQDAPKELKMVSQGKTDLLLDLIEYTYDESAGKGITVYVVDTGANTKNPEYSGSRFIFPGFGETPDHDEDDKIGHGSCVLSMVSSKTYGVAKNADSVVVKLQGNTAGGGFQIVHSTFMDALQDVKNDITDKKLQNKAVVNMSFRVKIDKLDDQDRLNMQNYLEKQVKAITELGVPITIAAGNGGNSNPIDSYPQLWAQKNNGLIVVGSVDADYKLSSFSQDFAAPASPVPIFAQGHQITCPSGGDTGTKVTSGTSFAAPKVAGLAAYFMALQGNGLSGSGQEFAENVKSLLTIIAYPRVPGAKENILWNNINSAQICKRDGSCTLSSAASGSASLATSLPSSSQSGTSSTSLTTLATSTTSSSSSVTSQTTITSLSSTTADASTSVFTSSASTTTVAGALTSLTCGPTDMPTKGIPQPSAAANYKDYCSGMNGGSACVGSDGDLLIGNVTGACSDGKSPSTINSKTYNSVGGENIKMNVGIALNSGSLFAVNKTICLDMFDAVTNNCSQTKATTLNDLQKWGGTMLVSDGNGDTAYFFWSISETAPPPPPPPPPPSPTTTAPQYGSTSCAPTTSPTAGIEQSVMQGAIDSFCYGIPGEACVFDGALIIGDEPFNGCQGQSHVVDKDYEHFFSHESGPFSGFTMKYELVQGHQYAVSSELCAKAMSITLNGCNTKSLSKYGGSIIFGNDSGSAANFSLALNYN